MKQRVIISALAGMALFAACTKDNSLSPVASSVLTPSTQKTNDIPTGTLASADRYAVVDYQLTVTMTGNQPVQWNSGVAFLASMGFDGYQNADDIQRIPFERPMGIPVKLLTQVNLGGIDVSALRYDAADLVLSLAPSGQAPALSLSGYAVSADGTNNNLPVQLNINTTTSLVAKWRSQLSLAGGQVYNARLTLDLSKLMNGVTSALLQQAQRSANGTVLISESSNVYLYNVIRANLENSLQVQLGGAGSTDKNYVGEQMTPAVS